MALVEDKTSEYSDVALRHGVSHHSPAKLQDTSHKTAEHLPDDLSRDVYCILGMPVDAVDMAEAVSRIRIAAKHPDTPYLLSTPNLNFLVTGLDNPDFRESLLMSDLCTADGAPIVWISRLLGLPISDRVAGSEIFDVLNETLGSEKKLRVFLFGGPEGAADKAGAALNAKDGALECGGTKCPGFGTVEDMSSAALIEEINSSHADFLVVALGAEKGQEWLRRNHNSIRIPVRSHLGAVVNFQAQTVARAPIVFQKYGLEWLWRIKEEPRLWKRYWKDGMRLLHLLATRILPLAIKKRWDRIGLRSPIPLTCKIHEETPYVRISLKGDATEPYIDTAIRYFRQIVSDEPKSVMLDLSSVKMVDSRFLGLLIMLRKRLKYCDAKLNIIGANAAVRHLFKMNEAMYLLHVDKESQEGAGGSEGTSAASIFPQNA